MNVTKWKKYKMTKTKKNYLTELESLRAENEQLSAWFRDAREQIIRLNRSLASANYTLECFIKYVERQSGSAYDSATVFERHEDYAGMKRFCISREGKVVKLK